MSKTQPEWANHSFSLNNHGCWLRGANSSHRFTLGCKLSMTVCTTGPLSLQWAWWHNHHHQHNLPCEPNSCTFHTGTVWSLLSLTEDSRLLEHLPPPFPKSTKIHLYRFVKLPTLIVLIYGLFKYLPSLWFCLTTFQDPVFGVAIATELRKLRVSEAFSELETLSCFQYWLWSTRSLCSLSLTSTYWIQLHTTLWWVESSAPLYTTHGCRIDSVINLWARTFLVQEHLCSNLVSVIDKQQQNTAQVQIRKPVLSSPVVVAYTFSTLTGPVGRVPLQSPQIRPSKSPNITHNLEQIQ